MWSWLKSGNLTTLRVASIALDLALAAVAFVAAYATAYGLVKVWDVPGLAEKTAAYMVVSALCLTLFNVHKGSWRYVSVSELSSVIKAAVTAAVVYTLCAFMVSRADNVPRSVPILTAMYWIAGLSVARLIYRLTLEGNWAILGLSGVRRSPTGRNVFLLGLSHSAESFIRSTLRNKSSEIAIVGILDEDRANAFRLIHNIKVLGDLSRIESHVARFAKKGIKVSELIITESQPTRQRLNEIVEVATSVGLKVTRVPDLTDVSSITSNLMIEPKPIQLEDLLGRPETNADMEGIAALINGRIVIATGAGGSIGSELCWQIASFEPSQLVITDSSEHHLYMLDMRLREAYPQLQLVTRIMNVRDRTRVSDIFDTYRPDVVFHAAALKHVPIIEDNPVEGIKTNVFGTRNVADAAMASGVRTMVMISTDKAVNPSSIMGATKRAAEIYCQSLDINSDATRFKTVRFGNVLGSNGSVVPRFGEQIAAGGPVTVTHPDIVRFFMTIPEAVRLVLHATAHALRRQQERGKIVVLDMGKPIRIMDLAERMIQLAGYKPHVDIEIVCIGLRPGEKLYEEMFDPSEVLDARTEEGYVVASPRVIDKTVLLRAIENLFVATESEDVDRCIALLSHIVPEYGRSAHARRPGGLRANSATES